MAPPSRRRSRSRSRSRQRRRSRSRSPSSEDRGSSHRQQSHLRRSPRRSRSRSRELSHGSRRHSSIRDDKSDDNSANGRRDALATPVVLPAAAHRDELIGALAQHQIVICVGETGSGKTTQIPQYLLDALTKTPSPLATDTDRSVVITQPRRVATVSVAQRVAEEMGHRRLGPHTTSPVGYTIRFDDQTSSSTRLKFVTDGVLVRECLSDATLSKYAVVMLDEAHERSLHTDILFGLLKQVLARRADLKLLVTSATLDTERFAAFFGSTTRPAPIVQIPGRSFPVDIFHSKQMQIMGLRGPLSPYVRAAVETTLQVHYSEPEGHILVFLTGQHEIEDACSQLRRLFNKKREAAASTRDDTMELRVLPLYGALPGRAQRQIFENVPSHVRKVIVATNIAETSLTIDGVRYVIDSGFTKQKVYNPEKQIESLVVVPISKVSAQQRAGRAGRTAPGKCFRLYSKASYEEMLDESIPEIQRTNLANTVLYLKVLGVHNVLGFEFLDPPEEDALLDALQQLFVLDAIDGEGCVTTMGKLMAQFPLEPKLSRVLIEAIALDCEDDMASIVAMLSVENVYAQQQQQHKDRRQQQNGDGDAEDETPSRDDLMLRLTKENLVDERGDQLTYLRLLNAFEKLPQRSKQQWCETRDLQFRALSTATSIRRQLLDVVASLPAEDVRILRAQGDGDALKRSRTTRLRRALSSGFFSHAVYRCNRQTSVYRSMNLAPGQDSGRVQLLHLHPLSTLNYVAPPAYCVYQELVATSRPFMRDVVQVEEQWVQDYARGKSTISTVQLFALSGADVPETLKVTEREDMEKMERKPDASSTGAAESTESKEAAVSAARARFLARQKSKGGASK